MSARDFCFGPSVVGLPVVYIYADQLRLLHQLPSQLLTYMFLTYRYLALAVATIRVHVHWRACEGCTVGLAGALLCSLAPGPAFASQVYSAYATLMVHVHLSGCAE